MARTYLWHLRNPDGAARGLEYATGSSAPTDVMLAHALPERVNVEVRDDGGALIAKGHDLSHPLSTPMARLTLADGEVSRVNLWPTDGELGSPVILPGGEVGILMGWWNADDHSEWRWTVEFSNHV